MSNCTEAAEEEFRADVRVLIGQTLENTGTEEERIQEIKKRFSEAEDARNWTRNGQG